MILFPHLINLQNRLQAFYSTVLTEKKKKKTQPGFYLCIDLLIESKNGRLLKSISFNHLDLPINNLCSILNPFCDLKRWLRSMIQKHYHTSNPQHLHSGMTHNPPLCTLLHFWHIFRSLFLSRPLGTRSLSYRISPVFPLAWWGLISQDTVEIQNISVTKSMVLH